MAPRTPPPAPDAPGTAERAVARNAAALIIGNELLSGKTQETNLRALATTLRGLGIALERAVFVRDDMDAIQNEVRALSAAHDVVVTSGGVGPTHDDITVDAVARAFDREAAVHPVLETLIREFYGAKTTDVHLRMARAPSGARLASTEEVRWPAIIVENVWLMPGIPEIFRLKLDILRHELVGPHQIFSREAYVTVDETELQPLFDRLLEHFTGVEIGSYPNWFRKEYRTKVTFDGCDEAAVEAACREFSEGLAKDQLFEKP